MNEMQRFVAPVLARSQQRRVTLALMIVGTGIVLALLLALPGQTITTKYVNDLFIFIDGAYRIAEGQVPNRDFHSSLGPLAFYLPALGYVLTGSLGAAMPVGMGLVVVLFALIGAHLIGTRMKPAIGLALAVFLLLVAAVPLNPGEGIADLSFAMFYNRLGWAALGFLLVLYLPPRLNGQWQFRLDALCATALTLFLLYLKISYGLVAVAFLLFLLTDRRQWRLSLLVLVACAAGCLLVELFWRGTAAYFADLRLAGAVSGDLPDLQRLTSILMLNLADVAVYLIFGAVLLLARRSFRDVLFVGFCGATGILIIEQNFQVVGILTLAAGAAIIASALSDMPSIRDRRIGAGLPLLLAILMLPVASQNAAALALHSALGMMRSGEKMPLPGFEGIRLVSLTNEGTYRNFSRYNQSLADGSAALAALDTPPQRVVVFDFVGPFTAGLGLRPARGDYPWYHWGRTIDDDVHPAAEDTLAGADVIMEPKAPIEYWTAIGMRRVYGAYLKENFRLARESADWRIYVREPSGSGSLANTSVTKQSTKAQP